MHKEFEVHILNDEGKLRASVVATIFDTALTDLLEVIGTEGREVAIVRTKMEEACFFAKKAMAVRAEYQN